MAGTRSISNCGSVSTCAYATIFQNVGDEDDADIDPISFVNCQYYGRDFGTFYRTLPATNVTTRPFRATSTYSSSSDDDDDDDDINNGWRSERTGAAVGGAIIAFLVIFVVLPVAILRSARKNRAPGPVTSAAARHQAAPPGVTPAPPYSPRGSGQPKPEDREMHDLPPPRYEDVGGDRIVR